MKKNDDAKSNSPQSLTRREFIGGAAMLGIGAALNGTLGNAATAMAASADAAAKPLVLTINDPSNFRILQITDMHLEYDKEGMLDDRQRRWKLDAIASMVKTWKPDLIANTGDFWVSKSGPPPTDTCQRACTEFAKFKTPWVFTWGNHDEALDLPLAHKTLESTPYALYRGGADGNYRIAVKAKGSDATIWNLIMLNTHKDGMEKPQLDWFQAEAERIKAETPTPPPAFLFFHIPIVQYEDLAKSGQAMGVKFEGVCKEKSLPAALTVFKDSGFAKAMFCGHDHLNDYHGLFDGMWLEYGRALGAYGQNRVHKGGKLITLDITKRTFNSRTVFADGLSFTFNNFTI